MRTSERRHTRLLGAVAIILGALAVSAAISLSHANPATGDNLGQLESELGANNARQSTIEGAVSALDSQVQKLNSQIELVQRRAETVQAAVSADQQRLASDQSEITAQQRRITQLKGRLALADRALAAELVSRYEQPQQSIVSVVINANGFQQMLDQIQFIKRADDAEERIIVATRAAKLDATDAEHRLTRIEQQDRQATQRQLIEARTVDGMQSLLDSRRSALDHAEAARAAALAAIKSHGSALQSQIATARRQEQEAQEAADQAQSSAPATPTGSGGGGAPASNVDIYDGWAIPKAIVMCESGGQNDPPNSAGASGYYQIIPSTWTGEGGTGPAAYLASRAEQDQIASKLWNGGAGASDWVCAGIVGIT